MNPKRKKVLFVCVENSCRSQIAEGFARYYGANRWDVYSAGSRPSGQVNPKAIASMNEVGIDLTRQASKSLGDIPKEKFDAVVTMGCGDACPWIPATRREDWNVPDPKNMTTEQLRQVRDQIENLVRKLLQDLGSQ